MSNDATSSFTSIAELKSQLQAKEAVVGTYIDRPPQTPEQEDAKKDLEKEIDDIRRRVCDLAFEIKPEVKQEFTPTDANAIQVQIHGQVLATHLSQLGRFNGTSNEATTSFLNKIKSLWAACPALDYATIFGSVRPLLSQNVIKTIDAQGVNSFAELKSVLQSNYGSMTNSYRKLKSWITRGKRYNASYMSFYSTMASQLEPIITAFSDELKQSKRVAGIPNYEPSFLDAGESSDLYSVIVAELRGFKKAEQIASRAESLSCQKAFSSANRANQQGKKNNCGNRSNNSSNKSSRQGSPANKSDDDRRNKKNPQQQGHQSNQRRQDNNGRNQGRQDNNGRNQGRHDNNGRRHGNSNNQNSNGRGNNDKRNSSNKDNASRPDVKQSWAKYNSVNSTFYPE
ncbi:Oidioi.mRNA.OKI2018_I69.YSR.g17059.t1.cds [Oikopleura dioica]|uniref:Oidioi.mRNA.OKI2018_I69.YSR.g17059.t1.cds n=1 Tax=Oikopleura dioica TaxID=34765 RepID=A0ABN7SJU2_OIKDI|nr:Oidioi.mRNA.OKI2018_I69.YSR.g17059.t1.cds [Oikopleura dioica]